MPLTRAAWPLCLLPLLSTSCGYVGGPIAPLANVPAPVADLIAIQRGSVIIARFSVPTRTTENALIQKPVKLDLRIGTAPAPFDPEAWAAQAHQITDVPVEKGVAAVRIPAAGWTGKEAILGVRVFGANGKVAGWSNYQIVPVIPPPAIPAEFRANNVVIGIHLSWTGPGDRFRIMRRLAPTDPWGEVAMMPGKDHEWSDNTTEYGKEYSYEIQSLVDIGNGKSAESDFAAPVALAPKDEFPPAVPAGLRAVAGVNSIELVWDRNTEPDLAAYRIYRAVGEGPFEKLADTQVPSYSDRAVEPGKTYRYAVSAVDKTGNESPRTGFVPAVLPN